MENQEEHIAIDKAKLTIATCETCEQLDNVLQYLELFNKQFDNTCAYNELIHLYIKKTEELNCINKF